MLRVFPISLTGAASHWLRNEPTGSIKTWEDLKTNFLNKYCPPGQTAKKIEEINNFQQEPDETLYQAWERFKELLMKGAVPTKTVADAKTAIQEMVEYSQKWHNGTFRGRSTETSDGLATIQAQLNNLGREIKKEEEGKTLEEAYYTQFGGSFQGGGYRAIAPSHLDDHYCDEKEGNYGPKFTEAYGVSLINNTIPQKEKDLGSFTLPCFINNTCFDNALVDLGASVSVMPLLTYLNLGLGELAYTRLTMELTDRTDIKVPLILGRPFLSTARAKIDVYKRKITLRVSLRERMELDLEARLMGETLVLNRSLDPFLGDYIELNDLNKPFELRRDQGDDLMPTIEEGEVIEEFSYCDDDKKIHIDCTHKLKFSCMIGFEFTHANFFPLLYVNMMSRKFHNSIMKNKMVYKGDNVVGALMNVPIFVGTFSVMTDFAVLEDMDAYHDDGMGDVIFGEPFLREVRIKTKQFEGIITLYNGDDEVTYQMDPITFEMRRWKNGSHAGTLACMSWNEKEAEEKSNLKTLIFTKTIFTPEEPGALYKRYQLKANQTPIRMDKSDAWRSVAQDIQLSAAKEAVKAMRNLQAIIQCKSQICFGQSTKDNHWSDQREDVRVQNKEARRILIELEAMAQRLGRNNI
ncbi:hypothetical protein Tco_1554673 [Tanacetum coccineum]